MNLYKRNEEIIENKLMNANEIKEWMYENKWMYANERKEWMNECMLTKLMKKWKNAWMTRNK